MASIYEQRERKYMQTGNHVPKLTRNERRRVRRLETKGGEGATSVISKIYVAAKARGNGHNGHHRKSSRMTNGKFMQMRL